ncbi:helix-turn-helix transcriptional regulator [Rhizobium cremeum]|uniref:helix-turn-helix domain-containing protein n=1 Tax=Rhizobium cremeum TaxID=2813827 RepID=UPI0013B0262B|nr:helix-turn-helix transcriptional regulator [Rhizobium cremeum]MCJ7995318.1 helix-turn-helix transcriptional regulator [Rhizobium cremeum]MCJ8000817.1 helix-turn-helix transcriptional regulator [Rhizobium cremeum]
MSMNKSDKIAKEYKREMLKSAFVSLFWSVISHRKKNGGSMKELADKLSIDKSAVSRWFSGKNPNWELNTIADIAGALDLDIRIEAVHRKTGQVFTCSGDVRSSGMAIRTKSNVLRINGGPKFRSSTTGESIESQGAKIVA